MRRTPTALANALAALDDEGLRRTRRTTGVPPTQPAGVPRAHVSVDGRRLVNFCSNDYLGLAQHPEVARAMAEAALEYGAGAGASHLVTGHAAPHARLEQALADYTGRERALVFSSGYLANLGAVGALSDRGTTIVADRLNHASLLDAGRVEGRRLRRYAHGDADAAEALLAQAPGGDALLVTDGVFSMDGDVAPLAALAAAARRHDAWLIVDDAHGCGVLGATGRGAVEAAGLTAADIPVLIGTLGKAFGTAGAFVAGDADLIEFLVQRARTYVYTTAMPPAVAAATLRSLEIAGRESWRRERALALAARFRAHALERGWPLGASPTPIQPLILGSAARASAASEALYARGYWVGAIRPPTVPAGTARLRLTFSAAHADEDVDGLLAALDAVLDAVLGAALAMPA